ncbi:MAG: MATE family efflux transporter [Bacteroidales bacterium]|nr:MATE family efflux transporter [Bacteroidales bacterium]
MRDNRDAIDFANEPVGKLFRKMIVPTLISMISMVILNLTDGAFVGHGAGSDALAAVNIAAPIFNLLAGVGIMFGIGSSVVASIHLSRGQTKAANINITQALIGAVGITLVICIAILSNLAGTCRLFGSNEALIPLASSYLKWIALCEPFTMFHMVGVFLVRLDGSPKYAMATSLVGTMLNIFLDWLFIFPFGWGLEGAAIATSISFSIAALMIIGYLVWKPKTLHLYRLRLTKKSMMLTLRNLGYQCRMGFSAMLGEVAVSGVIITGNYVFIHYLGEAGVAAYSAACYCFPVIFMMANAIVQSGQPIVSFAHGINNTKRQDEARRTMLRWACIAGVTISILMFIGAKQITKLFLNASEPAYQLCIDGLPLFGTGILFATLNIEIIGYLQSIEQSTRATIYTLLRGFVTVIPCFIFLPRIIGNQGMWLAIPVAEAITFLIILLTQRKH